MKTERLLTNVADIQALAAKLSTLDELSKLDMANEPQSWTVAYTLAELEESFVKFVDELLPKLIKEASSDAEKLDLLYQIADEFRHIAYHLRDAEFFKPFLETNS